MLRKWTIGAFGAMCLAFSGSVLAQAQESEWDVNNKKGLLEEKASNPLEFKASTTETNVYPVGTQFNITSVHPSSSWTISQLSGRLLTASDCSKSANVTQPGINLLISGSRAGWYDACFYMQGDATEYYAYGFNFSVVSLGSGSGKLINLSSRGFVGTGDNVMIAGFIVSGTKRVLIKAAGPSLSALGVAGALPDPTLTLYSGASVIASNDNWQSSLQAPLISATGKAPAHVLDSAILVTLTTGAYTAIVSGTSTGIALVSVDEAD